MSGVINNNQNYEGNVKPSSIEKAGFEEELFATRIAEIPTNMKARFEYNSDSNVIYAGYAPKGLAEGTDGWLIQKFTWVSGNATERNIGYGNWTNRALETYS